MCNSVLCSGIQNIVEVLFQIHLNTRFQENLKYLLFLEKKYFFNALIHFL